MFAGFPVHHMTDNVRVRWIQGRTLLRPRDRKGTAQTQYKYNNFIHFVCFDKIMIKNKYTPYASAAGKPCRQQLFPLHENFVSCNGK